jgi:tetratricopeptide (TPR) repeat protein
VEPLSNEKERAMFELKRLSREAIPAALERAGRYRLLNEPGEAESICLDVLDVDPENQSALVTLLLALTDQLDRGGAASSERARALVGRLSDEYSRTYYAGLICERRAKAQVRLQQTGHTHMAYGLFREAMEHFERAAELRPPGNDDAILRWNACARNLGRHPELTPESEEQFRTWLE